MKPEKIKSLSKAIKSLHEAIPGVPEHVLNEIDMSTLRHSGAKLQEKAEAFRKALEDLSGTVVQINSENQSILPEFKYEKAQTASAMQIGIDYLDEVLKDISDKILFNANPKTRLIPTIQAYRKQIEQLADKPDPVKRYDHRLSLIHI